MRREGGDAMARGSKRSSAGGVSSDGADGERATVVLPSDRMRRDLEASGLPQYLEDRRTRMFCGPDSNSHVNHQESMYTYLASGRAAATPRPTHQTPEVGIRSSQSDCLELDIVGASPSFANALRRILIAEVPTMAIEHVFFLNNTSTIPDEILAHRLGLIPILADPDLFRGAEDGDGDGADGPQGADDQRNTVVFRLKVANAESGNYLKVLSERLEWLPDGSEIPEETGVRFTQNQKETLGVDAFRPVHHDILVAKLSKGQEIELEAHCKKGTGAEHAKWSPVSTAWYRLLPEIVLLEDVRGPTAKALAGCFPAGCHCPFEVTGSGDRMRAEVKKGEAPLGCLERVRALSGKPEWKDVVQLRKVKDHFIFTIESTGVITPPALFERSLSILEQKAMKWAKHAALK